MTVALRAAASPYQSLTISLVLAIEVRAASLASDSETAIEVRAASLASDSETHVWRFLGWAPRAPWGPTVGLPQGPGRA